MHKYAYLWKEKWVGLDHTRKEWEGQDPPKKKLVVDLSQVSPTAENRNEQCEDN